MSTTNLKVLLPLLAAVLITLLYWPDEAVAKCTSPPCGGKGDGDATAPTTTCNDLFVGVTSCFRTGTADNCDIVENISTSGRTVFQIKPQHDCTTGDELDLSMINPTIDLPENIDRIAWVGDGHILTASSSVTGAVLSTTGQPVIGEDPVEQINIFDTVIDLDETSCTLGLSTVISWDGMDEMDYGRIEQVVITGSGNACTGIELKSFRGGNDLPTNVTSTIINEDTFKDTGILADDVTGLVNVCRNTIVAPSNAGGTAIEIFNSSGGQQASAVSTCFNVIEGDFDTGIRVENSYPYRSDKDRLNANNGGTGVECSGPGVDVTLKGTRINGYSTETSGCGS